MTNAPTTRSAATGSPQSSDAGTGDQASAEVRNIAERGKQGVGEVADEARSQASELARTARDQARDRADGEVGKLAGLLRDIGDELEGMADGAGRPDGHLQGLARDGAQAANRLSQRLERGGLDGALHDVTMFARRRPGVFLAGALGVGIVLGRVTRNADLHSINEEMHRGDGSGRAQPNVQSSQPAAGSGPIGASPSAPAGVTAGNGGQMR